MVTLAELQKKNNWTHEQTTEFAEKYLGMPAGLSDFTLAMEKGEVEGDVIVVDNEEG